LVGLTTTGVQVQVISICSLMSCLDYTSRQQYIYIILAMFSIWFRVVILYCVSCLRHLTW